METKDVNVDDFLNDGAPETGAVSPSATDEPFDVDEPILIEGMQEAEDIDSSIKFKLDQFEGPLDLLYHLIKAAKIDIRDIFISQITEQYLELMKDIDTIDMEKAADFTLMAATLLEIKSNKLLPKPEVVEDVDEEDPEEKLYRQLEEYELFKNASEKLHEIEDPGKLYKKPDPSAGDYRYVLPENLSLDALINAFSSLMHRVSARAEEITERKIEKDRFTVAEKIAQIKDSLIIKPKFMFSELFEADYSKSEIINTFLALLELLKEQLICAQQNDIYGDIEIIKKEEEHGQS